MTKKSGFISFYEKMKDISEKVIAYENKLVKKEEKKSVKIPFFKLISETFNITTGNFVSFAKMAFAYSIIVTLVHTLTETGFACGYKGIFNNFDMKCDIEGIPAILYAIFHIFIFALFSVNWQKFIVKNSKEINYRELFTVDKTFGKFIITNIIYTLFMLIPVLSLYLLYTSKPHQDYRVELTYFVVVASGFIVPFILTRFTSIFSKVIIDGNIGNIRDIWKKTEGNNIKILFVLLVIFLISITVSSQLNIMLRPNFIKYPEMTGFIGDLINNILICFYISLFMNFSSTQRELLSKGANDNE